MAVGETTLAHLNRATREHHGVIDHFWRSLSSEAAVRSGYVRRLRVVYGFQAAFEGACASTSGLADFYLRRGSRSGLIAKDLLALGLRTTEISNLAHCSSIAPFNGAAEACGWVYVVERATMVLGEIRRQLAARMPSVDAFTYLDACSPAVGPRWDELGHAFDRAASDDAQRADLIEAAHQGFRCLAGWYRTQLGELALRA